MQNRKTRQGWQIENDLLTLTTLEGGGHFASLELRERPGVNPLWAPVWDTMDPWRFDPRRHAATHDTRLLASICGHNLCLGWFGGPSPEEAAAGLGCHGEAPVARWRAVRHSAGAAGVKLVYGCDLPVTGMTLRRTITLARGSRVIRVRETLRNRTRRDLPFTMAEHVTFGPPFLKPGVTTFDMSATAGHTYPLPFEKRARLRRDTAFIWPQGPGLDGQPVDLRTLGRTPARYSDFTTQLMDPARDSAWFAAVNAPLGLLTAYVWRRTDFPWVGNWEENRGRTRAPWAGRSLTRGMEFANTPFPMALRQVADRGLFHGLPTLRWLPARGECHFDFAIVLLPVTPDCRGVADVVPESDDWADGFRIELLH